MRKNIIKVICVILTILLIMFVVLYMNQVDKQKRSENDYKLKCEEVDKFFYNSLAFVNVETGLTGDELIVFQQKNINDLHYLYDLINLTSYKEKGQIKLFISELLRILESEKIANDYLDADNQKTIQNMLSSLKNAIQTDNQIVYNKLIDDISNIANSIE